MEKKKDQIGHRKTKKTYEKQDVDNKKRNSTQKKRKKKNKYKYVKYKIYVFALFIAIMMIVSLIYCLLPIHSGKKEFPSFTVESFLTGDYFQEISLWYNDRFIFRVVTQNNDKQNVQNKYLLEDLSKEKKILFGENTYESNEFQMIIMPYMNESMKELSDAMDKAMNYDPKTPMIALTFDDGPSQYTDRLLDILSENEAKATFYLVGSRIDYYPDTIKKMAELKMEFGNHTYEHSYLSDIKDTEEFLQLSKVDEKLMSLIEMKTTSIRPPGGYLDVVPSKFIDKPFIFWSVDTRDWASRNKDSIVEIILENSTDGSIILLHDLYESTVDAMEIVIPKLKERGYELVTVTKLAQTKGYNLKEGESYFEFPLIED